jgi:hypothetical protein
MEPMEPMEPMTPMEPMKPMAPMKPLQPLQDTTDWLPAGLGSPSASGAQNGMRALRLLSPAAPFGDPAARGR